MSDIKYTYPLILNKVASPQYATPTLRRARLIDWLNDAAGCRAAVIAADAGYGKTTLLWQWEREVPFPCYWYKLDRNDRDWTFHISYLIEAISKRHKGFGRRAHSMLQQLGGPGSSRPGVAAYLLAEMHERLTEPCTFIIDDWHYVNAATEVRGLWNQILRDAPSSCRFVFASRVKPKLQFARFKTHSGYAELRTDALRFTEAEIEELFRDIYNDPLEPTEVAELERRTEGWAASLQLVEVSLRERPSPDERREFIHSITATKDSDLFDFLAEEVLDQQPEETRNFLLATSILQQITPEVAERLAGVHDGRRELTDLEHRGLFTNRLDDVRFRYHNLFREFLERRLVAERTDAEVVGLHIHAASYFETTEQWPEAIHHYLRAGLQRQAARLIAKYGEDVVAEGRLGLVDEWLQALPEETIRQNARLSLLYGEACGIRGDWDRALEALERARSYFARKGDRRLESLACLKLSSVYSNYGDTDRAVQAAEDGVALVPEDAIATRLRLEGNLAITRTMLTGGLGGVVKECQRIAVEAKSRGLDHFSAIAHHNAGSVLLQMGKLDESVANLERAARFWSDPPTSPFADNADLVIALLSLGKADLARRIADESVRRTAPWPRPLGHALYGRAAVHTHDGRFEEAIRDLIDSRSGTPWVAGMQGMFSARLIECLFLAGHPRDEIMAIRDDLDSPPQDKRYELERTAARAITVHLGGVCRGRCFDVVDELTRADERGERFSAALAAVKVGAVALDHHTRRAASFAWYGIRAAKSIGALPLLKWWTRKYAAVADTALREIDGVDLVIELLRHDAEEWRPAVARLVAATDGVRRTLLLESLARYANRQTIELLGEIQGSDVSELRRKLRYQQAARLYVRSFGTVSVHRSEWAGPEVRIEKRRVRTLLGLLAAHVQPPLSRDAAVDLLWPASDGDAAINSLNQTVFQLRRYLDPGYRAGESPEYVVSNAEQVSLNAALVRTDLEEVRRLCAQLPSASWKQRHELAGRILDLVRGDYLGELRYEGWAEHVRMLVSVELRRHLLPIAESGGESYDVDVRTRAGLVLLQMDPFDESAILAMASTLQNAGKAVAARSLLTSYATRLRDELDDSPSPEFGATLARLGITEIKSRLTEQHASKRRA